MSGAVILFLLLFFFLQKMMQQAIKAGTDRAKNSEVYIYCHVYQMV
jgi:hypothetical protein